MRINFKILLGWNIWLGRMHQRAKQQFTFYQHPHVATFDNLLSAILDFMSKDFNMRSAWNWPGVNICPCEYSPQNLGCNWWLCQKMLLWKGCLYQKRPKSWNCLFADLFLSVDWQWAIGTAGSCRFSHPYLLTVIWIKTSIFFKTGTNSRRWQSEDFTTQIQIKDPLLYN